MEGTISFFFSPCHKVVCFHPYTYWFLVPQSLILLIGIKIDNIEIMRYEIITFIIPDINITHHIHLFTISSCAGL